MTNNIDALGFNRMEIANVRRCYASNKLNYNKLNKLYEKAAALKSQIDELKETMLAWEEPVRKLSLQKLNVELTSEEIMLAHNEPEKFFKIHPELLPTNDNEDVEAEVASIQAEESEGPEL